LIESRISNRSRRIPLVELTSAGDDTDVQAIR
jgi:hypothetical protein